MTDALFVNLPVAVAPSVYFSFNFFSGTVFSCFFIRFSSKFPVSPTPLKLHFDRRNPCCSLPVAPAPAGPFSAHPEIANCITRMLVVLGSWLLAGSAVGRQPHRRHKFVEEGGRVNHHR